MDAYSRECGSASRRSARLIGISLNVTTYVSMVFVSMVFVSMVFMLLQLSYVWCLIALFPDCYGRRSTTMPAAPIRMPRIPMSAAPHMGTPDVAEAPGVDVAVEVVLVPWALTVKV